MSLTMRKQGYTLLVTIGLIIPATMTLGQSLWGSVLMSAASPGTAIVDASGPNAPEPPRADIQSLRPKVDRDRQHLERITALVEAGAVRLPEITVFALSEAATAHAISESRHLRGNLVLAVR